MMMTYLRYALAVGVTMGVAIPAFAQPGLRLADDDMKPLFEAIDNGRDRFEDQLDGRVKNSIIRGPRGEVNVSQFLEDFQEHVKLLPERFTPRYAASAEVATVLREGTDIHRFIKAQPSEMDGGSEWDRLVVDLTRLAEAYGTSFPLPADARVRRINDAEASSTAASVATYADRLKGEVGKDNTIAKPERDAIRRDLDLLKKQANVVKDRASDGDPATAEARQLAETAARIDAQLASRSLAPAASTALTGMRGNVALIQQAYAIVAPPSTP